MIQSEVFQCARQTEDNMLVCAPTGSGKTFIALLCMLAVIEKHRNNLDAKINLDFKIIYIAPMKALVSEVVGSLTTYLSDLKINVKELTGDVNMTKQQI